MIVGNFQIRFETTVFKIIYKSLVRRSVRHILQGRLLDPEFPEKGRWLRSDVNILLRNIWQRVDELLELANLREIPSLGNRNNVFLAVVTTAAYQVLLADGHSRGRAATLVADVGWKLYEFAIKLVSLPFRMTTRDSGKRIDRSVAMLLKFPFNAPGRPGYEVKVMKKGNQLLTNWTWCPPQTFVRNLVENHEDSGELEAFYQSWCLYDWPGADIMAGDGQRGHYSRRLTLSKGDAMCNMCWHHKAQ